MYYCDLCNKEFKRACSYIKHLRAAKINIKEHRDLLIKYYQSRINDIHSDINVLNVSVKYSEKGHRHTYITIFNSTCKHTSEILLQQLLKGQSCSNSICVSNTKRLVAFKLREDSEYRKRVGLGVKQAFKNLDCKFNRLQKQAESQRTKASCYELFFRNLLIENNISFEYQVPMLLDNIGCILDFYLPDSKLYVNINMDQFHTINIDKVSSDFRESVVKVQNKDKFLREEFRKRNMKLIEIYSYDEATSLVNHLVEGGDV